MGVEKASRVGISVPDTSLQYYIIHGPSPLAILERYTLLTGRPGLPPSWTFGLWLSTSFLTDYDSKTVSHFLQGMKDRQCDVRVFHFDCFWMKKYEWYKYFPVYRLTDITNCDHALGAHSRSIRRTSPTQLLISRRSSRNMAYVYAYGVSRSLLQTTELELILRCSKPLHQRSVPHLRRGA